MVALYLHFFRSVHTVFHSVYIHLHPRLVRFRHKNVLRTSEQRFVTRFVSRAVAV